MKFIPLLDRLQNALDEGRPITFNFKRRVERDELFEIALEFLKFHAVFSDGPPCSIRFEPYDQGKVDKFRASWPGMNKQA